MHHTPECQQRTADSKARISSFAAVWPDYCRKCNGYGFVTFYEHVSCELGSMPVADACEHCVADAKCPRCAAEIDPHDDDIRCESCGWADGAEGAPAAHECYCWTDTEAEDAKQEFEQHAWTTWHQCAHGLEWQDCNPCMVAGDLAYDAAREGRCR